MPWTQNLVSCHTNCLVKLYYRFDLLKINQKKKKKKLANFLELIKWNWKRLNTLILFHGNTQHCYCQQAEPCFKTTVIFLSFRTDRSRKTVQTHIRLLLIRVYTVCNSLCILWMHYSKETPSCSTFKVITINFRVSEILGFLRYRPINSVSPILLYRKFPKYSDTQTICWNHSKIWTMWLYHRVMSPNDAVGMANSVDPDQTAPLGLHC